MMRALKAELLKLLTTKLWWIMAIGIVLIMAVFTGGMALIFHLAEPGGHAFEDRAVLDVLQTIGHSTARILALVVGVMVIGGEYRHKTLATTYLAVPNRYVVMAAKIIVVLLLGFFYGLIGTIAAVMTVSVFSVINDVDPQLFTGDTWQLVALSALTMALWTLMGMAFGILIRNMIAAVIVAIAFAYMVEPMVTFAMMFLSQAYPDNGLWSIIQNLMPSGASMVVIGVDNPLGGAPMDPFPWVGGLLVMIGWTVVPTLLGALFTVRRDVD